MLFKHLTRWLLTASLLSVVTTAYAAEKLLVEANEATISGDFVLLEDGITLSTPQGTGDDDPFQPEKNNIATFNFEVETAASYEIQGNVLTPDGDNSFFVQIDNAPTNAYLWDTGSETTFELVKVTNRGRTGAVSVFLTAGQHTIKLYKREDGAQIRSLELIPSVNLNPAVFRGGDVNIVAHQDDDLLFMNPDLNDSIDAGNPLTTIFVTAGDAGLGGDYVVSRENGIKAAYAYMAGVENEWVDEKVIVTENGKSFEVITAYLVANEKVRTVFLRIPDNYNRNNNWPWLNKFDGIESEPVYVNYNDAGSDDNLDLIDAIRGVLDLLDPTRVRIQDYQSQYAATEHLDHLFVAEIADIALKGNDDGYHVISYVNYAIKDLTVNLDADVRNEKRETFLRYSPYDGEVRRGNGLLPIYEDWLKRQYIAYEEDVNPDLIGDENQPPTVTLKPPQASSGNVIGSIEAEANDSDGQITKVEFWYDGNVVATMEAAPYVLQWENVPDGSYTLNAKAYDDEEAVTESNSITVVVNRSVNTLPVVTLGEARGSAGNVSGSIEATASDSDGSIARVEFYYNDNLYQTLTTAPYVLQWGSAPDGTYELTAKAYDDSGAVATSNAVTVEVNSSLE